MDETVAQLLNISLVPLTGSLRFLQEVKKSFKSLCPLKCTQAYCTLKCSYDNKISKQPHCFMFIIVIYSWSLNILETRWANYLGVNYVIITTAVLCHVSPSLLKPRVESLLRPCQSLQQNQNHSAATTLPLGLHHRPPGRYYAPYGACLPTVISRRQNYGRWQPQGSNTYFNLTSCS